MHGFGHAFFFEVLLELLSSYLYNKFRKGKELFRAQTGQAANMLGEKTMERFVVRCGNFEILYISLRSKHIRCNWENVRKLAIEKAMSDNCEEIAEFDSEEAALNALKKHHSYIDKAQFCVGSGFNGCVYWCDRECGDDFITQDTLEYSDFDENPFETDDNDEDEDED